MVPENFRDWACSLSGCDGGSLNSDIWISGIEWGKGSYEDGKYYREELPSEIRQGKYIGYSDRYNWTNSLTYPFGRSFAKLFSVIRGNTINNYKDYIATLDGGEVFKFNLYPIAFDSTDPTLWEQFGLDEITGFREKYMFQAWCFYNRFPFISSLVRIHKPKVVICTGVSYLLDFFACFGGGADSASAIESGTLIPASANNSRTRIYYRVQINETTTLFVIPFFTGASGLNSDHLLQEMGQVVHAEYT